jgi:hypothetical protein
VQGNARHRAVGTWRGRQTELSKSPLYTRPAWSPDGSKLAFDRLDNSLEEIWIVETKTLAAMKAVEAKKPEIP